MKKFAVAGLLSASVMATSAVAAPFSDIAPNHWAYKQINALYDAGIVRGDGTGKFKGQERISRYEASVLVYQAIQHVAKMKSMGQSIDPEIMDTINALITELTDEMQVAEVRIEENSDGIAQLKQYMHSMHGKPSQGASMSMGNGRIKFMGQAMFSVVSGGDNSAYSATNTGVGNPAEGATEFIADYFDLGIAADIDDKTSFHTRASIYTGGHADSTAGGNVAFDDYMYFHVNDLWSDWDMTLGRMYLPYGHEVGGVFRTNPYFVTTSMVEQMFGVMVDGAYFSTESDTSNWHWGAAIHNGEVIPAGNRARNHANHTNALPLVGFNTTSSSGSAAVAAGPGVPAVPAVAANPNVNNGGANNNSDDDMGYLLQVGNSHHDGDFKWDLTWVNTGGDLSSNANNAAGNAEMDFFNFGMTYRANEDWQFNGEYVDGSVQNFVQNAAGTDLVGRNVTNAFNAAAVAATPGMVVEDDYSTWYLQAVYNLANNQTLGLRYSSHELDRAGARVAAAGAGGNNGTFDDEATEWAFAWTRKISDNGTLILEYSTADVDLVNGQTMQQRVAAGAAAADDFDVIRASYRIDF